jgi:hypothetical protein
MSTTKKDLYVGTDKHKWWKEAVVYQVRFPIRRRITIDEDRSTPRPSKTPTVMAGETFLELHKSSTT